MYISLQALPDMLCGHPSLFFLNAKTGQDGEATSACIAAGQPQVGQISPKTNPSCEYSRFTRRKPSFCIASKPQTDGIHSACGSLPAVHTSDIKFMTNPYLFEKGLGTAESGGPPSRTCWSTHGLPLVRWRDRRTPPSTAGFGGKGAQGTPCGPSGGLAGEEHPLHLRTAGQGQSCVTVREDGLPAGHCCCRALEVWVLSAAGVAHLGMSALPSFEEHG